MKLVTFKTFGIQILAAVAIAMSAFAVQAEVLISAGSNTSGKSSMSIGLKANEWGVSLGIIQDAEFQQSLLDYPVPHASYVDLGTQKTANTIGGDFQRFFELTSSTRMYGELGMYAETKKHIAQSTVTGWNYTQEDKSSILLAAGVGIQYVIGDVVSVGVGFHTLRGNTVSIGVSF
jgi:hypothetical protein